jgi:hypothetical protein
MKAECIDAVGRAMGRRPTQVETRDIENRIRLSMRRLAAADPQGWQQLTAEEQLRQAGQDAATALTHEAAKRRHRQAMAIKAHDRMRSYIDSQVAAGADKDGLSALSRMLTSEADGKNNIVSVEGLAQGIEASASTFMTRTWNVAGGKFLNLLRDKAAESALVRALHGDTTVPEAFRKAAADFHEVAERLRQRFNADGGDIGRLDNWGMPHSWSRTLLLKVGKQAWTDGMLPLLDRAQYVHEDGRSYSEPELRAFLDEAWRSVVTGGANKIIGGERLGGGIKANRNASERQIHLSGADAYLQAMRQFSERSVLDAMMGHIRRLSRDIALIEQFGPNADRQFAHFVNQETAKATDANPAKKAGFDKAANGLVRLYNYLAGNGAPPPETVHGKVIKVYRELQVLKLGSSLISSFSDHATMHLTAHVNGIPKFKLFLNNLRTTYAHPFLKSDQELAASAGLMVRTYAQQLARYGGEIGSHGWSSRLTNTFMKVTLLPYFTEARRRAFSYGMMDQVGKALRQHDNLATLNEADQRFIKHAGITETDWQIMRLAMPDDWGGNHTLITPEAIYRIPDAQLAAITNEHPTLAKDRAAANLMAFVYGEQDRAVIEPHAKSRLRAGADRNDDGGLGSFLLRSFTTFKSFSFEMFEAHIKRALHGFETKRGSAAYMAALIASTTVCGAVANGIRDIIFGRDPRTLTLTTSEGRKNWLAAMITGGGLGLYGDFLINTYGSHGSTLAESAAGPLVSDIAAPLNAAQAAIAASTDPDAAALQHLRPQGPNVVNTLKSYVPGASLWYTRAAMDRLIFNQLSDYFSPGYLSRMKARARQQHRPNWWEVDQATPSRAPNLDTATQ